jgi:amidase
MEKLKELTCLDGIAQAELVRAKEVKPIELVEAAIARIESLNPSINAVVTNMFEAAIACAKDEENLPKGPFRGVPYLLKDILGAYAGVPLTSGCAFLREFVPDHDSELVARLKRAGSIILGKTNTPEFGLVATTEPRLFGPTRNPWDLERMTGGSSGGSSAAVASGMVPMAHANDGGGSIRIPASCCGVFGLKPTRARITLAPDFGDIMGGLVAEHAVTRSVRDSAALLDATAGPAPGDPYFAAPPARPFLDEVGANPGRLRVAFTASAVTGTAVHPDCVQATRDAATLCASLGHDVVEDGPKLNGEELVRIFMMVWAAGCAASIDGWSYALHRTPTEDQFEPLTWHLYQIGTHITASSYLLCQSTFQRISRDIGRFMNRYDLLLTPTLAQPPLPLGSFSSPPFDALEVQQRLIAFTPFTPLANITGQPAMSVPLYWNPAGLPIGTQFVSRFGEEATLFRLAAQLESARPWASHWPPVSALK